VGSRRTAGAATNGRSCACRDFAGAVDWTSTWTKGGMACGPGPFQPLFPQQLSAKVWHCGHRAPAAPLCSSVRGKGWTGAPAPFAWATRHGSEAVASWSPAGVSHNQPGLKARGQGTCKEDQALPALRPSKGRGGTQGGRGSGAGTEHAKGAPAGRILYVTRLQGSCDLRVRFSPGLQPGLQMSHPFGAHESATSETVRQPGCSAWRPAGEP